MNVLIVGAGPAGAATALLLARQGIDVRLVERESNFARVFRGEGLMPSGVEALLQMGLGDVLAKLPGRRLESWDVYAGGREVMSVREPIEETGDLAVRVIPQEPFLEALVEQAAREASFHFDRGVSVRGLVRENGRVVGARLHTSEGEREARADLVIGCDGRASLVRKRAEIELALLPEHYDVLWFKLPTAERLRGHCRMLLLAAVVDGRVRAGACYTSWDDRLQFAWALPKGGYRDVKQSVEASDWALELGAIAPEWLSAHLLAVRDEIEGPVVLDVIVGRCPKWSAPGVLLLGDAAHPMSPIRAQGINLALRDAIVAANHLVPIAGEKPDPDAIDAASRAIQAEREPEVVRAQTLQMRDTRGMNSRAGPVLIGIAKHVGGALGRFQWARNAWLSAQHDLRFGSTEVRLRV